MDIEILDQRSQEIKDFVLALNEIVNYFEGMVQAQKPNLKGETYLGNKDVCKLLHISSRTLQEYRDKGTIAFIKLEGKILYKQSDIDKLLNDNYFPALE
jgi:hypothetical protein